MYLEIMPNGSKYRRSFLQRSVLSIVIVDNALIYNALRAYLTPGLSEVRRHPPKFL